MKRKRLSFHDCADNQVRLQLLALAYDPGNFLRRLALPELVKHRSLTTLREKLIKIGAKVIRHSRYVVFHMAEVAISRGLFADILGRIRSLAIEAPGTGASIANGVLEDFSFPTFEGMGVCWWRKFGRQEGNLVSLWGVWNLAEVVQPFDFGPESQNQVGTVWGGAHNENNLPGNVVGQRHLGNLG